MRVHILSDGPIGAAILGTAATVAGGVAQDSANRKQPIQAPASAV